LKTVQGLIRHGRILTADEANTVIEDGAIAFDEGRVVALGPTQELDRFYRGHSVIDAQGAIVRPGFIDAHIHVSQYTARSVLPRMGTGPLNMGHWKGEIRPEDERASAALAAIDYLACGYTGFVDPGTIFEPDAVAPIADDVGIRIWLTDPYVADRGQQLGETSPELVSGNFLARWPKSKEEAAARIGSQLWRNRSNGLARAFVGIYGENTETDDLLSHAIGVARAEAVQFQMHLGYTVEGYRVRTDALGCTPLRSIAERDGLDAGQSYTHVNYVDDADASLIAANRPALIWCPYGTLQMIGHGGVRNRMSELERAGAAIALATDIPRAVNFDGIAGVALGCAAACGQTVDPWQLLAMRTRHAAVSVGAGDVAGRLAPGFSADIVVERPHELDVLPVWESAILSGRGTVLHVFVAGRQVVSDGELNTVDVGGVREKARESTHALLCRIGLA
jgi:cytosine/adenosine deaminase-related metal-dependent hydrolase